MKVFAKLIEAGPDDEEPPSRRGKTGEKHPGKKHPKGRPHRVRWGLGFPWKKREPQVPLSEHTRRILEGVRSLPEISAKEIMLPRVDVDFLDKNSNIKELEQALSRSNHSRLPVYEETTDKIVGILYAKDLIPYWVEKKPFEVAQICREAYFVPESMKVDILLSEFQRRHVHIAMVVDEYGGISGIVCLEDILEEIVGDIQDEFDEESEEITTLGEGTYLCDARLNIEDLNEELNLALPTDDCDTVGGFVFSLSGKIPSLHEKFEYENVEFIVQKLEGHRIERVKVIRHEVPAETRNTG
ncbi:MAG: hemolysin family protein [Spirochaetota bacterium]